MAEQDDNWFGSWLSAAKDKSTKVLEFVKKDLEEFGTAVKHEASLVVSSTGNVIEKTLKLDSPDSTASSMKRSFSSFLGQMNTVLNPSPDDSDTEAILIVEDSETVTLTKLQKAVYDLQKNESTFLEDPDDASAPKFQCWLEIIDDQLSEDRINKHLKSSVVLKNQYEKLVPDSVPHSLFWKRYLFKKALLEDEIAHQEAMEKKEKKESATVDTVKWEKGLPVIGYEVNEAWWLSKYSNPQFIPLKFPEQPPTPKILNPQYALLFCYFNDGQAFQNYVKSYQGRIIIIIGPGSGAGRHTDPTPFAPNFPTADWTLHKSQEVKNTKDFIAVYARVGCCQG